jgi:hypothetical protein
MIHFWERSTRINKSANMVMPIAAPVSDFLAARENYKLALARHNNQERRLFELFGVDNSADLEDAILKSRAQGIKHVREITEFSELSHKLDRAADQYDLACEQQRRKIAEQQRQFNHDLKNLEC